uniref:Uncharacterized protein n=1 Tax=Rhizophora mucronata TaxID=61149 RepID=A0A2P2NX79_RHIMU
MPVSVPFFSTRPKCDLKHGYHPIISSEMLNQG